MYQSSWNKNKSEFDKKNIFDVIKNKQKIAFMI